MACPPITSHYLNGMSFSMFTTEEILKLSVKEIVNPQVFDAIGHPTIGGLYDPALGPIEQTDFCSTCHLSYQKCPGHYGHIKLPIVVFNPILFKTLHSILKGVCFQCNRFASKSGTLHLLKCQMKALEFGLIDLVEDLSEVFNTYRVENGKLGNHDDPVIEELTETLASALKGFKVEEGDTKVQIKNIVVMREEIVNNFLSGRCFHKDKCPFCLMPLRQLKSDNNAKLFFANSSKVSRTQMMKKLERSLAAAKKQARKENEDFDFQETGELVDIDKGEERLKENRAKAIEKYEDQQILSPSEAKRHFALVWENESELLGQILGALQVKASAGTFPTDVFFTEYVTVTPPKYRPLARMTGMVMQGGATKTFSNIMDCSKNVKDLLKSMKKKDPEKEPEENETFSDEPIKRLDDKENIGKVHGAWVRLQTAVNCVYDGELDRLTSAANRNGGVKQLLEKKEGLFRKHMMGKRVDFAARSVISPDPYINTNEIGIPEIFARKLYYPTPVTHWNFTELRQAVINGPEKYPGACFVFKEDGLKIKLDPKSRTQREAIAKQLLTPSTDNEYSNGVKRVCRHIQDGDVLLLNRQPTLHRPSIQAHKARVLKGEKTLRLHYANCKAYNADFDGDEMNAHFPQDEISRAEAYFIASTEQNYLVPKDGTPLAGLIQDHMVAGVRLSIRGRFFDRHDYQQLVFAALTNKAGPVIQIPPCIIKPRQLWSGKQVLSTVLLNIIPEDKAPLNLDGKSKISGKSFKSEAESETLPDLSGSWCHQMDESHVVVQDGQLLVGVLDKGHYGATAYGLVHCCYELYGGAVAGMLLSSLAKLFTAFLQFYGFTLGVEDILCTGQGDQKRREIMAQGALCGHSTAAKAFNLSSDVDKKTLHTKLQEAHFLPDGGGLKDLDLSMKGSTDEIQNEISGVLMPVGLLKNFPSNNLQLMVQAGAKGSMVNCMQISCLLGQIELEGRRPPLMMSGQSLPSFPAYETSPRAGGFIDGRFLTGIRPQEYFFHCMAGREGLVDTAVKTSRSGYLQRCIIKHLEGLTVAYDQTVRDSDGSIIQFDYGTDGLEITKTQFLNKKQIPFLVHNQAALQSDASHSLNTTHAPQLWDKIEKGKKKWQEMYGEKLEKCTQINHKWYEKDGTRTSVHRTNGFLTYCEKKWEQTSEEFDNETVSGDSGRTDAHKEMCDLWARLSEKRKAKYSKTSFRLPDPILAQIKPNRYIGAVTEKFQETVNEFVQENMGKIVREDGDKILRKSKRHISESKLRSLLNMNYLRSLVPPGEPVGLIAAQSIGEPSTQMTLNTFHFAGRGEMNVTLGIPRLREILMVASERIMTPAMDVPLIRSKKAKKRGTELRLKLNKVLLNQVIKNVDVTESLSVESTEGKGRIYKMRFQFLPKDTYDMEYCVTPGSILRYMEAKFFVSLVKEIESKTRALVNTSLLRTSKVRQERHDDDTVKSGERHEDDDDDDLSDDEQHDGDAVAQKALAKKDQENDYEGEEEEKAEVGEESDDGDDDLDNDVNDTGATTYESEMPSSERTSREDLSDEESDASTSKFSPEIYQRRVASVLKKVQGAISYNYDTKKELWCELEIKQSLSSKKLDMTSCIDSVAESSVVYQIPGINRCFLSESKKPGEEGLWRLKTEGVNMYEMYKNRKILNLNQLYTNDIHAMANRYGIEAACSVLIQEINDVFGNYGITVDYRHLSLIADYMTFEGRYKAFNRKALESNASPLQKMTFETTMNFLQAATISGNRDDLKSPSSRLVAGQLVKGGTGAFEVLPKILP